MCACTLTRGKTSSHSPSLHSQLFAPQRIGPLVVVGVTVIQAAGATGPAIQNTKFVIDSVIECNGEAGSIGIGHVAGGYVARTYTKGCSAVVEPLVDGTQGQAQQQRTRDAADAAVDAAVPSVAAFYTVANEVASGMMWWDGNQLPTARIMNVSTSSAPPPSWLTAQHVKWDEATFPSFERRHPHGVVADAVLDCGAHGDGQADDTAALQHCLDAYDHVFVPKGLFRISMTLHMRPGTSLVGLSQVHSTIAPSAAFGTGTRKGEVASSSLGGTRSAPPTAAVPLLRTAVGGNVTIAYLGLVTWWHVPDVFTLDWRAADGLWRSNYETRVCECLWLSDYGSPNTAHGKLGTWPPTGCKPAVNLTVPKTQVRWMAALPPVLLRRMRLREHADRCCSSTPSIKWHG